MIRRATMSLAAAALLWPAAASANPAAQVGKKAARVGWVRGQPAPRPGKHAFLGDPKAKCNLPKDNLTKDESAELDRGTWKNARALTAAEILRAYPRGVVLFQAGGPKAKTGRDARNFSIADTFYGDPTNGAQAVTDSFDAIYRYAYQQLVMAIQKITEAYPHSRQYLTVPKTHYSSRIPGQVRAAYAGARRAIDALERMRKFQLAQLEEEAYGELSDEEVEKINARLQARNNIGTPASYVVDEKKQDRLGKPMEQARQALNRAWHAVDRYRKGLEEVLKFLEHGAAQKTVATEGFADATRDCIRRGADNAQSAPFYVKLR